MNNAAISDRGLTKESITIDDEFPPWQVNYLSPFLLVQLFLPILLESIPSRVINLSSVTHRFSKVQEFYSSIPSYATSKLALTMFSCKKFLILNTFR